MKFVLPEYDIRVNNDTRPKTVLQQVVALSEDVKVSITYSMQTNDYISVNSTTGEIVWKGEPSLSFIG